MPLKFSCFPVHRMESIAGCTYPKIPFTVFKYGSNPVIYKTAWVFRIVQEAGEFTGSRVKAVKPAFFRRSIIILMKAAGTHPKCIVPVLI